MTTPLPNIEFDKSKYKDLPYLNIDASTGEKNIKLEDLFEYQQLFIPDDAGKIDETYSILNIKKQFICVKIQKPSAGGGTPAGPEQSRIYVKKPVIDEELKDLLPLIKKKTDTNASLTQVIVFNGKDELNAIPKNKDPAKSSVNEAVNIFEKVYQKIDPTERPYFAEVNNQFKGGNKRGGTRKVGGSRSR